MLGVQALHFLIPDKMYTGLPVSMQATEHMSYDFFDKSFGNAYITDSLVYVAFHTSYSNSNVSSDKVLVEFDEEVVAAVGKLEVEVFEEVVVEDSDTNPG